MVDKVIAAFPEHSEKPIITFVLLLVEGIKMEDWEFFKGMIGNYGKQVKRDPAFIEYVDRIAKYYFDQTVKQANPMQQML
jgi:hypothetical protein